MDFKSYKNKPVSHIWHENPSNDILPNDTKVTDLMTLTYNSLLEIAFSELVVVGIFQAI